jgi:SAM-dependent methyltransferase
MTDLIAGLESRYYAYLYANGHADADAYRQYLTTYLDYIKPGSDVLDIGCGSGDFLDLARAKQCRATGVDSDQGMLGIARERGLNVIEADVLQYVAEQAQADSYDFIFASNFIEHLTPNVLIEILAGCFRLLRPSGRLLVATPNPESLHVHLYEFWRDLTHVRLYNPSVIEFLFHDRGFVEVKWGLNAATGAKPVIHTQDMDLLKNRLEILQLAFQKKQKQMKLKELESDLAETLTLMSEMLQEIRQLQNVFFYIYPPREYYVTGIKSS